MSKVHNIYNLTSRRKELRKNQTPQEKRLWWYIRDKRLGIKFRRQHSIGGYITDFFCSEKRLVIEIDGSIHKNLEEYDKIRDKFFRELNYKVLRFSNTEVEQNINEVIKSIKNYLA